MSQSNLKEMFIEQMVSHIHVPVRYNEGGDAIGPDPVAYNKRELYIKVLRNTLDAVDFFDKGSHLSLMEQQLPVIVIGVLNELDSLFKIVGFHSDDETAMCMYYTIGDESTDPIHKLHIEQKPFDFDNVELDCVWDENYIPALVDSNKSEYTHAVIRELAMEIYKRVFDRITTGAGLEEPLIAENNIHATIKITQLSSYIARDTHRASGNIVVVTPAILHLLQNATFSYPTFRPTTLPDSKLSWSTIVREVGTLNGSIRVFCTPYSMILGGGDYRVIVGYTGVTKHDAGLMYTINSLLVGSPNKEGLQHFSICDGFINNDSVLGSGFNYYRVIDILCSN